MSKNLSSIQQHVMQRIADNSIFLDYYRVTPTNNGEFLYAEECRLPVATFTASVSVPSRELTPEESFVATNIMYCSLHRALVDRLSDRRTILKPLYLDDDLKLSTAIYLTERAGILAGDKVRLSTEENAIEPIDLVVARIVAYSGEIQFRPHPELDKWLATARENDYKLSLEKLSGKGFTSLAALCRSSTATTRVKLENSERLISLIDELMDKLPEGDYCLFLSENCIVSPIELEDKYGIRTYVINEQDKAYLVDLASIELLIDEQEGEAFHFTEEPLSDKSSLLTCSIRCNIVCTDFSNLVEIELN